MKIPYLALACVLAVGAGGAFAADKDASKTSSGPSVVDKTKNTVRNAGEKLGQKLHLEKGQQQAARKDGARGQTHAMGASRRQMQERHAQMMEDEGSTTRQQRMDEAYARWQSQQQRTQQ